jgi:class 3 adenylate cyclase/pimeloyl-ACP methyl ester carboxylesterase
MEPQVKYARTSDGVNIAYYTLGSGPPFVWLTTPQSHLLAERRIPAIREALDGAARFFTLVRLDPRGFGLSDREITDFSLDCTVRDVKAVIDKEKLGPVILLGIAIASLSAVKYASMHPGKVSHLILMSTAWAGRELANEILDRLTDLAQLDWDLASETIIRSFYGPESNRPLVDDRIEDDALAAILRESVNPPQLQAIGRQVQEADVSDLLPGLPMPALILHDRYDRNANGPAARRVAAEIPNGRFVEIDNAVAAVPAIAQFLASTGALASRPNTAPAPRAARAPSGMTAILFADIADSTALTERLGDDAFRAKARDLDAALRTTIREHIGTPIEGKLLGDGVLAVFTSARQAIEAALACGKAGDDGGLPLHLGLHAGDVIREDNNVYGGAVNIASRISGLSAPGEVLVSETVRSLARTSAGVRFEDRGDQSLKGVGEPVRVWAVREASPN